MRAKSVAWVALCALCACKASPRDGIFACREDGDCPSGWTCRADHFCYEHPDDGSGPTRDAGHRAKPDAGPMKQDAGPGLDAGNDSGPADAGQDSGDGGPTDPCAIDHGGCDPLVTCHADAGSAQCGDCPGGYEDSHGDGTLCTDIDECQSDNGGCGDPAYGLCTNVVGAERSCSAVDVCGTDNGGCGGRTCSTNVGSPPTCGADIDECAAGGPGDTVCSADYPCVNRDGDYYFCRGLMPEWGNVGVPGPYQVSAETVVDDNTGLMWQRIVPGNFAGCSGGGASSDATCTWAEAKVYCANLVLDSHSDWRLPTITELESLIRDDTFNPAIDTAAFPGTPSALFWSFSPYAGAAGNAWGVGFNDGLSGNTTASTAGEVRCVR